MSPGLVRKVLAAFSAAALGILFMCGLVACYIFTKFVSNITKDLGKYQVLKPSFYSYPVYMSGYSIAISGGFSAFATFLSIIVSGAMSRQRTIVILVGTTAAICTLACAVSEGIFYHSLIQEYLIANENYKILNEDTEYIFFQHYRNNSNVQKYIKNSLAQFYEQGYESLKLKYPNAPDVQNLLDWESLQVYIGKIATNVKHIFNYPDLWEKSVFYNIALNKTYLIFREKDGKIYAYVSSKTNYNHIVASLKFFYKGEDKFNRYVCWATSESKYDCNELSHTNVSGITTVNFAQNPWTLGQIFALPSNEYYPLSRSIRENLTINYLIENFPISYRLLNKAEVDTTNISSDYPFYYQSDSNHYKFSADQYVKDVHKVNNAKNTKIKENDEIYWCIQKPTDWDDAFVNKNDNGKYKCSPKPITSAALVGPITNYYIGYNKEHPLKVAFDMINIGLFPDFFTDYFKGQAKNSVFDYTATNRLAQLSLSLLLVQVIGIIFWACGFSCAKKDEIILNKF